MKRSDLMLERLRENTQSGCSPVYLRALKGDLTKLLSQYMSMDGIEIDVKPSNDGYKVLIEATTNEFFNLGKTVV